MGLQGRNNRAPGFRRPCGRPAASRVTGWLMSRLLHPSPSCWVEVGSSARCTSRDSVCVWVCVCGCAQVFQSHLLDGNKKGIKSPTIGCADVFFYLLLYLHVLLKKKYHIPARRRLAPPSEARPLSKHDEGPTRHQLLVFSAAQ